MIESVLVFSLASPTEENGATPQPTLGFQHPNTPSPLMKSLKIDEIGSFCFPSLAKMHKVSRYAARSYTFALTINGGRRVYCFCKRLLPMGVGYRYDLGDRYPVALCLVTLRPLFDLMPLFLDVIQTRYFIDPTAVVGFVNGVNSSEVTPGGVFRIRSPTCNILCEYKFKCPTPLEQGNPLYLLDYFTTKILTHIVGAVMTERRIIFVGDTERQVAHVMFGLLAILLPFEWQHIFIPVLPDKLLEYAAAPAPFLIGIMTHQVAAVKRFPLGDAIFVYINKNEITAPSGSGAIIPLGFPVMSVEEVVLPQEKLTATFFADLNQLATRYQKGKSAEVEGSLKAAWFTFHCSIFGDIVRFFQRELGNIEYGTEVFIQSIHDHDIRSFLKCFKDSQMFDVFLNERIELFSKKRQMNGKLPPDTRPVVRFYDQIIQSVRHGSTFGEVKRHVLPHFKTRTCGASAMAVQDIVAATASTKTTTQSKFAELARRSYDATQARGFMMGILKRLRDHAGRHWKMIMKQMVMLEFLLSAGSEILVSKCLDHIQDIYRVMVFKTTALGVGDQAIGQLRASARRVYGVLTDFRRLRSLRSPAGHALLKRDPKHNPPPPVDRFNVLANFVSGGRISNFEQLNTVLEPLINTHPLSAPPSIPKSKEDEELEALFRPTRARSRNPPPIPDLMGAETSTMDHVVPSLQPLAVTSSPGFISPASTSAPSPASTIGSSNLLSPTSNPTPSLPPPIPARPPQDVLNLHRATSPTLAPHQFVVPPRPKPVPGTSPSHGEFVVPPRPAGAASDSASGSFVVPQRPNLGPSDRASEAAKPHKVPRRPPPAAPGTMRIDTNLKTSQSSREHKRPPATTIGLGASKEAAQVAQALKPPPRHANSQRKPKDRVSTGGRLEGNDLLSSGLQMQQLPSPGLLPEKTELGRQGSGPGSTAHNNSPPVLHPGLSPPGMYQQHTASPNMHQQTTRMHHQSTPPGMHHQSTPPGMHQQHHQSTAYAFTNIPPPESHRPVHPVAPPGVHHKRDGQWGTGTQPNTPPLIPMQNVHGAPNHVQSSNFAGTSTPPSGDGNSSHNPFS